MVNLRKKSLKFQIISFITLIFLSSGFFIGLSFYDEVQEFKKQERLQKQEILSTLVPFVETLLYDKKTLQETLLNLQSNNKNIAYILIEKNGDYYMHSLLQSKAEFPFEIDKLSTRLFNTNFTLTLHYKKSPNIEHLYYYGIIIITILSYFFIIFFVAFKFKVVDDIKEKIRLNSEEGLLDSENVVDRINAIILENRVYEEKFNQLQERFEEQLEIKTASLIKEIKNRKSVEINLEKSVAEKVLMLKEIHHRVKNNMAIITGLIRIQARKIDDEEIKEMFVDLQNRIKTMELIHTSLYRSNDFQKIDFSGYIIELMKHIKESMPSFENIKVQIDCYNIFLDIEEAIACGQIINELVTNSFKYAFPTKQNALIKIDFTKKDDTYVLEVKDNGIGLENRKKNKISIGMSLVNDLTKYQLKGNLEVIWEHGVHYKITFRPKEI